MKQKIKKFLLIGISAILIAGASAGYYLYQKGPLDVKESIGIPVMASELYAVYSSDTTKANSEFTSKVIVVKGEISDISVNSKQQKIVLLRTGIPGAYINCSIEEPAENIKASGVISIKGICSGIGEGDPAFGIMGDVYLTRCLVTN